MLIAVLTDFVFGICDIYYIMKSINALKAYIKLILESSDEDLSVVFDILDPVRNERGRFFDQLDLEDQIKFISKTKEKQGEIFNSLSSLILDESLNVSEISDSFSYYVGNFVDKNYVKRMFSNPPNGNVVNNQYIRGNIQNNSFKINTLVDDLKKHYETVFNSLTDLDVTKEDVLSLIDELREELNDKLITLVEKIISGELWTLLNDNVLSQFVRQKDPLVKKALIFCGGTSQGLTVDMIFSFISNYIIDDYNSDKPSFNIDDARERYKKSVDQMIAIVNKIDAKLSKDRFSGESEAPPDAPLGRIAFSPDRKGVPLERNTKVEDELFLAIRQHFELSDTPLSKKDISLIQSFISQGLYNKIFSEPKVEDVFRGMSVDEEFISSILNGSVSNSGVFDVNYTFKPYGDTSSWTDNEKVSLKFAKDGADKTLPYTLIMHARVSENPNKFIDSDGLYQLQSVKYHKSEKEIIGLGDIIVNKIEWKKYK